QAQSASMFLVCSKNVYRRNASTGHKWGERRPNRRIAYTNPYSRCQQHPGVKNAPVVSLSPALNSRSLIPLAAWLARPMVVALGLGPRSLCTLAVHHRHGVPATTSEDHPALEP